MCTPGLVSVIVPVFDEEEVISKLIDALEAALPLASGHYEVVCVDDGSRDRTFSLLEQFASSRPWLKVVSLEKNVGQGAAIRAGFDHAAGEFLVTMDGDLQNPPSYIPLFVSRLRSGTEFVMGNRVKRGDKWATRKLPSVAGNWLLRFSLRYPFGDVGCGLRAYSRKVAQAVFLYREFQRYASITAFLLGFHCEEIEIEAPPRVAGRAKYGLDRVFRIPRDIIYLSSIFGARIPVTKIVGCVGAACLAGMLILSLFSGSAPIGRTQICLSLTALFSFGWLTLALKSMKFYAKPVFQARYVKPYVVRKRLGIEL